MDTCPPVPHVHAPHHQQAVVTPLQHLRKPRHGVESMGGVRGGGGGGEDGGVDEIVGGVAVCGSGRVYIDGHSRGENRSVHTERLVRMRMTVRVRMVRMIVIPHDDAAPVEAMPRVPRTITHDTTAATNAVAVSAVAAPHRL